MFQNWLATQAYRPDIHTNNKYINVHCHITSPSIRNRQLHCATAHCESAELCGQRSKTKLTSMNTIRLVISVAAFCYDHPCYSCHRHMAVP